MDPALSHEGRRITRFLIVGSISVFTYYAFLFGLTEYAGVWYITSAIVAFVAYYCVNFLSQKFWTFKNRDRKGLNQQLAKFTAMAIGNWILNTVLLYLMVEYLGMWYLFAQAILTIVVSTIAYVLFKHWIFRND
ncbi:MAG: GtrA family protein, partial [Patescibacteria group bacterium]